VRHKISHKLALPAGVFLTVAFAVTAGRAVDPWDTGATQPDATPTAPSTRTMSQYDLMRQVVPGSPVQPTTASRPSSWPGGTIPETQPAAQPPAASAPAQAQMVLCEDTQIMARVGSEGIFAKEVMGTTIGWKNGKKSEGSLICTIVGGIDEILEPYKSKMSASQFEAQRTMLIKQRLLNCVQTRIIYLDAKQNFPAEHFSDVEKQLDKYYETMALPALYKGCEVKSMRELDQKLRARGLSLEVARKSFKEWVLAQECVGRQIKRDEEITYDQMHKFYEEHIADFQTPAQAKWEELMAQFSKFHGKTEAFDAICRMGNEVLGGTPFAEVAKNGSHGITATNGGAYPWTTKGSLKYAEIDDALFGLPVGTLSQVIETEKGYHIIRITERADAETTPFRTAQVDIKEKIVQQRANKQLQDYLERIESKIPVWTIYDGDRKDVRLSERMKELSR
jgi:hypothetical protein